MAATNRINVHVLDHEIKVELTVHDCASCGVVFGMPSGLVQSRRQDGAGFFCPNGHSLETRRDHAREHGNAPGARDELGRFAPGSMRLRVREFPR
ncbi:MAG: hypothetical protein IT301_06205 [Dehalococcoidia bacterium]|nr:hypothetical protein [Dehalococcoidia bacterium]